MKTIVKALSRCLMLLILFLMAPVSRGLATPDAMAAEGDRPGADVFVTSHLAPFRGVESPSARILNRLPAGTRLKLLEGNGRFLRVELADEQSAVKSGEQACVAVGFLESEDTAVFLPGPEGSRELVTTGRVLARNPIYRRLAAAFLLRGTERLREDGVEDPRSEVLLGETAEALARAGGPFPAGLELTSRLDVETGKARLVYSGNAFERALACASRQAGEDLASVRERALAGLLRAQFPESGGNLTSLWQETAGWLALVENAKEPAVLRDGAERLGLSALTLGRFLLAVGKLEDVKTVEGRVRGAGDRLATLLPGKTDAAKLRSRADLLAAMRGDGTRSFPQESHVRVAGKEVVVRIEGELGALNVVLQTGSGKTWDSPKRRSAVPVLPVPGSVRVSPDGKWVGWLEVARPTALLAVVASLEKDEPAREIVFLVSGRPLRDRAKGHVLTSLKGFSRDGRRLGVAIKAWDETPPPTPRLSVVNVATGELLFETSQRTREFGRLLE